MAATEESYTNRVLCVPAATARSSVNIGSCRVDTRGSWSGTIAADSNGICFFAPAPAVEETPAGTAAVSLARALGAAMKQRESRNRLYLTR
jgi:hypothetical protein